MQTSSIPDLDATFGVAARSIPAPRAAEPPPSPGPALEERFGGGMREETNRALERGALLGMALGLVSCLGLGGVMWAGLARGLEAPLAFAALGAMLFAGIYSLARRRQVWGVVAWPVALGIVSIPTVFYFATHVTLPGGAATYVNGPLSYLYLVLIVITGALFRFRISVAAGVTAAAGYLACVALALPSLQAFAHPDPQTLQDLVDPAIYGFRAMMIVGAGFAVGGTAVVARRLVERALRESREKASLSRLFGEYVSEEVREKLLHDPPPADGDLEEVAILFSDIRGFTTVSESMEPQELVRRLNRYFDAMVRPIRAEGGVVDKFVGDAIMAVFGGAMKIDDPSAAAVRAAQGMAAALDALNEEWRATGLEPFEAGIGIHFGTVVVGSIGSADRKDFTVIGDAVNTASRVEGLTKEHPYPILVTRAVADRLPRWLADQCEPAGRFAVKGRREEVEIYGLEASGDASPAAAGVFRGVNGSWVPR